MKAESKSAGRVEVGVDLPAALLRQIDAYARTHSLLPTEALPYLIAAGLSAEAQAMSELAALDAGCAA